MAHPHKSDHETTGKTKLNKVLGEPTKYDSSFQRAEKMARCTIDGIKMKQPEDSDGHLGEAD